MSDLHTILFILERAEKKEVLLTKCHKALLHSDCQMEKEDSFITFNDGPNGESEDVLFLDDSFTDDYVLELLSDWNFLGSLDYSHNKLNVIISINYVTFDLTSVQIFDFGVPKTIIRNEMFEKSYREFLIKFTSEVGVSRFCYDVGHLDYTKDLNYVLSQLNDKKFEFDIPK